jgi:hypothetical protein
MKTQKTSKTSKVNPVIATRSINMPPINQTPEPPAPKTPKTKIAPVTASKPEAIPNPKITKKSICIEMVNRKGGATLDEMAQEIANQGICSDLTTNRVTCSLWMHKIGFKVDFDKDSKTYRRA